ncbi:unnamed protein product [Knipowitschia caucasica]
MSAHDGNKKLLLELVKRPENSACADCGARDPDWGSCTVGVFVCLNCSGIHRSFSHKVRSIKLDFWEDSLVECMRSKGNAKARELYEKSVPCHYYRPQQYDHTDLREQWIRAKYERLEFTGEVKYPPPSYITGFHEGHLWKKQKEGSQFNERMFVLSEKELTLAYYIKDSEFKGPKAVIPIKDLNAMFQPKIGHSHGLQLTYQHQNHTRNIYVYHETSQEIVTWFNCIRAARYAYLKTAYPTGKDSELIPMITHNSLKEGFMEKTGPMQKETFKKRWFVLDSQSRKLFYYKSPLDAHELGAIFIGMDSNNYAVEDCTSKFPRGNKWKCGVTLDTPERQYLFMCQEEKEQKEWLSALRQVLLRPMAPQDYATEANINNRK